MIRNHNLPFDPSAIQVDSSLKIDLDDPTLVEKLRKANAFVKAIPGLKPDALRKQAQQQPAKHS